MLVSRVPASAAMAFLVLVSQEVGSEVWAFRALALAAQERAIRVLRVVWEARALGAPVVAAPALQGQALE